MMALCFFIATLMYLTTPLTLQPVGPNFSEATLMGGVDPGEASEMSTDLEKESDPPLGPGDGTGGVGAPGLGKEIVASTVLVADILSNPKGFLENANELDPKSLEDVIEKIQRMLATSEAEAQEITDILADKLAAFNEGSTNVLTAETAVATADEALKSATADLATVKELHVVQTTEKNDAQENYDNNYQGKLDEQQVLKDVLNLLNGLPEAPDSSSSSEPGWQFKEGCDNTACSSGRYCAHTTQCSGCTLEECQAQGEAAGAEYLSYRSTDTRWCRLCTKDQVRAGLTYKDWGIYKFE